MIFRKIFLAEFAYQTRRISTWLYLLVLLAFTIGMKLLIATGDGVYPNNTLHITGMTIFGGLIWLLIGASVAGEAAARDVQMKIHPLIYTTSVSKLNYLAGRFLAALAVNALLILALPLGLLLSFYLPGMVEGELLPFRPVVYLNVLFLIALPTVLVATALQFTFAVLGRGVMTAYIAGLLLAIFPQMIALSAANIFINWDLTILLDPIGIAGIVGNEMQTWTPTDKNTRLISLEGMFLWNRVLWLSVAAGLLWFTYQRFSFTHQATKSWWGRFKKRSKVPVETSAEPSAIIRAAAIHVPRVQQNFGFTSQFRQAIRIALESFRKIARNPLGIFLIAIIAIASAVFGFLIMTENGIPMLPTTQQVIGFLTAPVGSANSPWVIIPLLLIFFSGELVWNERDKGINDIADGTPVQDWVLFTGKYLGIVFIIVVWMGILMLGGILMQLILGYDTIEISLYIKALFGLQFVDYLLFALLALVVHVIVNQKYIGYLIVLLMFGFIAFPYYFGVEHNMLIFGAAPGWWYSDMRGFGPTLGPWIYFKFYWIAWALLLAVAARLLWPRGKEQSLKARIKNAHRNFKGSTIWVAIIGAGILLTMGSYIFYNTNVLNEYVTSAELLDRKAEYEKRYGRYRNSPQPQLTATMLEVDLYPDRQRAEIRGAYTLVNSHLVAIDTIQVGSASGMEFKEVKFNMPAEAVVTDKELSHHIYVLEQALKPGDSLQFEFIVNYEQKGFDQSGSKPLVVENGTYFTNFEMLPTIGYNRYREISDAAQRKKYNLYSRPALPSLYDAESRKKPFSKDQTTLDVLISTAKDEVAVTPGILQKNWTEGNRNYFHYKTEAPIGAEYSILSANYKVQETRWNDVAILVYYHPAHDLNIEKMLESAKASLEYYSEQFGPYPYKYLTLIERAGPGSGGTADAGIIYYGEQYPLLNSDDSPTGFALPYYILAHEVAHQWWGLARLTPAYVEGAGVLIEGLSVYSGMQVLEKNYGDGHLQKFVNYLHSSYALPRSLASANLLQANEEFLYYKKGGLAMYTLSKYIGKEKVNSALRNLLLKRTTGELPVPTTLDLYRELQIITPDSLNYLLNDLFEENTYWRLKTKQFSAEQTKEGIWEVKLKVQAQKITVDSTGEETEVKMNDWLEIGIYEEGKGLNEPLYLKMHRVKSGEQEINVTVPRKPLSGGIDPNYLMIDLRHDDNIKIIEE